jgi:hypothetical protein
MVVFPSGILKRKNSGYGPNCMDIVFVGSSSDSSFEPQRDDFSCRICVIYQQWIYLVQQL